MPKLLEPLSFLKQFDSNAVIWLNGSCEAYSKSWDNIWNGASRRYCTDGGANAIVDRCRKGELLPPHKITGDFDSITAAAKGYFSSKSTLIETPDQDETDMSKCMQIVNRDIRENNKIHQVIVLGGFSGRFDHTLASLNSLLIHGKVCGKPYYALDDTNMVTVLDEGVSEISLDLQFLTKTCGFIPFCQKKTIVSTKGFKWDLDECSMEFGGIISTSNQLISNNVIIETSTPLIFTVELKRTTVDG